MTDADLGDPAFLTVAVSFVVGIAFGLAVALPAVQDEVAVAAQNGPGPLTSVLLAGMVAIVVVSAGLIGFYQLFRISGR